MTFPDTTFTSGTTITSNWLNAVNDACNNVQGLVVNVKSFGATGDGVTDDTAAIQAAAQSLTGNQTLYFPDGTYLISYIWTPYSDSDPINGRGRGRGVCYFNGIPNIRLYGPRATIKCVNHDIATYGGFTFAWIEKSPGFTVDGFTFDMTFTGYNNSSSYYPMCGGVFCYDGYQAAPTQDQLSSNFTAQNLTFKLYHPLGAFAETSHPYGSDTNNGYKVISVAAFGNTLDFTTGVPLGYRTKNLLVQNIRFLKGHNCYGTWGYSYDNATFRDIVADAWVASKYNIDTATRDGVTFVAPVRYYQFACENLTIDNVQVLSLPWSERVDSFYGYCGGVSVDSGMSNRFSGGANITNCSFILDDDNTSLGSYFDVGIRSSLSGNVRISNNSFGAWRTAGCNAIYIYGTDSASQKAYYTITGNISSKNIAGCFIEVVSYSDTSKDNRTIKSLIVSNNVVRGWGGAGAIFYYRGNAYYGCDSAVISDNIFDGSESSTASTGSILNIPGNSNSADDKIVVTNNILTNGSVAMSLGTCTPIVTDNITANNSNNSNPINYLTNNYTQTSTWTAGQTASITVATGERVEYSYNEFNGSGQLVYFTSGIAITVPTTGVRVVGAGNTGYLTYKKIGTIR